MHTLHDAWARLKALLESAMKSKPAAGAKADLKKTNQEIQQFVAKFAHVMADLEAGYKLRDQANAKLRQAAEDGMKLLQPVLKQVDDAHKDGFNADNSLQENVDGRLTEMMSLLKELKSNGCQVQWD